MKNNKNTLYIKVLLLLVVSIGLASTVSAATWTSNEFTWNSLEGDHYSKFTCNVGDTLEMTKEANYIFYPNKLMILGVVACDSHLFRDITPGGRHCFGSGTYEAVNPGYYSIWEWQVTYDGKHRDILYEITVLP